MRSLFTCLIVPLLLGLPLVAAASPEIEHWTTANGARVFFVRAPDLPMVDARLAFQGGSARDGKQKGIATLTMAVLGEGAGGLTAEQISDRFSTVGANHGGEAAKDMAWLSLRTATDPAYFGQAVDTFQLVLVKPDFPQDAIDRQRNRILVSMEKKKESPQALADEAFFRALYGDHPYGSPSEGAPESLKALTRADLLAFHKQYFVAKNAVLALVGDLDSKSAHDLAERLLRDLPPGEQAAPLPSVPPLDKAVAVHVALPFEQTHVRMGQPAIVRGDPDFYALQVGNYVLGGNPLVSRLFHEIRELRGLSYNVSTHLLPMAQAGPFRASLESRNAVLVEAVNHLKRLVAEYIAKGPTEKELLLAKKGITGGFPLLFNTNAKIVEILAMISFYHLPLDYLRTYVERIDRITAADVVKAFQSHLDPAHMALVTVGGAHP